MESDTPHVVNLINSVIGVGILAMPFCFSQCGLLLGALVLAYSAWATFASTSMLINSAKAKKKRSYEYLSLACFGPQGKFSVEFAQIGLMLGTCIAFYIVISSLLADVFGDWWSAVPTDETQLSLRRIFTIILGFFIVLPLGLLRDLSQIAYFAYFSSFFYIGFIGVVTYRSIAAGLLTFDWVNNIEWWEPSGIFRVLPIFALAFTCQSQLFIIYASMDNPPVSRMTGIMKKMIGIVAAIYLIIGLLGYSMFGSEIKGNMLLNYSNDVVLRVIKFGFAMSVIVGFPLMIYPCRQSIFTCFVVSRLKTNYSALKSDAKDDTTGGGGGQTMAFIPDHIFRLLTLAIVVTTMTFAFFIQNVETILGLNGALMGSFIAFILPSLCYKKACSEQLGKWDVRMWKLIFFTGVGALMLGVVQNLPKAEVIEIEYPTDYIEPIDKQKIDELTENMRNKLDTDLIDPDNPRINPYQSKEPEIWNINKYPKPVSSIPILNSNSSSQIPTPQKPIDNNPMDMDPNPADSEAKILSNKNEKILQSDNPSDNKILKNNG